MERNVKMDKMTEISVIYRWRLLWACCWQVGKLLNTPWVKFVAQATSYLFFLCVILAHGHVEQGKLCLSRVEDVQPMYHYYQQVRAVVQAHTLSVRFVVDMLHTFLYNIWLAV